MKAKKKLAKAGSKKASGVKIVCRCEEVTEDEVRAVIRKGYHSLQEIKRILRTGMGHCGGRGCLKVIARLVEEETGIPIAHQKFPGSRPPLKPIPLGQLGSYENEQKER
jgi:bacterioferritin-associated ferredoxin